MADETKLCSNCKRDISIANFVMHEMHCRRHIILCEHCGEPVHRTELEQHFSDLHAKIPCEKCQQLVQKSDMTKHLAGDCSRKLMRCEFCEISLPKNELDAHIDYCGSRTEFCPICKQYIMQKDKLRHESSRCSYPEARPQPVDPFSMGDLQQFMTNAVLGNRNSTSTTFMKGKISTNKKSELNSQRAKNMLIPEVPDNSLNSVPPDLDYDTMLALQLAHEDWLLDENTEKEENNWEYLPHYLDGASSGLNDFSSFLDSNSENWSGMFPAHQPDTAALVSPTALEDDENMSIPCQFCEENVRLSAYNVHMDYCPLAFQRRAADLNNEQVPVQQIIGKAAIPVINNLRPSNSSLEYHTALDDDEDDVLLPCEFCQEIFPSDIIIQHQSICQADGIVTPRTVTPTRLHRNIKPQSPSNQMSFKPSIKSPSKRQKNPALTEPLDHDDSNDLANGNASNVRLHKINQSSSDKYSLAYDRFDEALTRPPRHTSRQHSHGSVDIAEPIRESRSILRTRVSLNQLLQEDENHEAACIEDTRKELGVPGGRNIKKPDQRERKTKVDSRTVGRQMEENRQKPVQGSSGRTSMSQNISNPPRGGQTSRNRQRADHVFSPELRLKPNNSPPPKKR